VQRRRIGTVFPGLWQLLAELPGTGAFTLTGVGEIHMRHGLV
jgi:hypothetical protein